MVFHQAVDWGDVPGWVSAVTTVFAFAGAAYAAYTGFQILKMETRRDESESHRGKRSQASLVSAWWGKGPKGTAEEHRWGVYVRNSSNGPVYQAHFDVEGGGSELKSPSYGVPVLPSDDDECFFPFGAPASGPDAALNHQSTALADCQVSVSFTDSSGVRWRRDHYGRLDEQSQKELTIWAAPEAGDVLREFAADSLARYDVRIHCRTDTIGGELAAKFRNAQPCPDILIGPHDWVGLLAEERSIRPIAMHDDARARLPHPQLSLDSMTYQDNLYAVPSSLDTVVLVRNTDLAPEVPHTIEELLARAEDLKRSARTTDLLAIPVGREGNPFHIWPLFHSGGGWLFRREADRWVVSNNGVAQPESIAAFERLQELSRRGVLREEVDTTAALDQFVNGRVPFMLATLGPVLRAMQSKVHVGISNVPRFADGTDAKPMVAVNGLYVAHRGENADIAMEFVVDYATRPAVSAALASLGGFKSMNDGEASQVKSAFAEICLGGLPMPNFRQMDAIWHCLARAELDLLDGRDPAVVAGRLEGEIDQQFASPSTL